MEYSSGVEKLELHLTAAIEKHSATLCKHTSECEQCGGGSLDAAEGNGHGRKEREGGGGARGHREVRGIDERCYRAARAQHERGAHGTDVRRGASRHDVQCIEHVRFEHGARRMWWKGQAWRVGLCTRNGMLKRAYGRQQGSGGWRVGAKAYMADGRVHANNGGGAEGMYICMVGGDGGACMRDSEDGGGGDGDGSSCTDGDSSGGGDGDGGGRQDENKTDTERKWCPCSRGRTVQRRRAHEENCIE
ncbi:hypothetical protein DFH07DRAFT_766088 [Mycena maculata]|uniref:Uncharacterized protein n=1 Tax=Mycena maculata TaxID=230809 RepID=A0AAD7K3X2_9AGAR|nr:hypothetical protein DFH07DRAFT_766088 [Mycena maculata]